MKIYNSLTRRKDEFSPIKKGHIGIYVCGPTVYDEPHIGHARSAYIFDVIRRYLEYKNFKVMFVRNVTDIDDKIIEKAKKEKSTVKEVSKKYLDAYRNDMELLGIGRPDKEPEATGYIPKMIKFIELLIERGCAYEAGGDVYFDIKKASDYGKLSNQNLEKMEVGARIAPGEKKKDPLDFALWKSSKGDEPSWPSTWSDGRPGWHIECSVMSSSLLGDEFDIHGGGIDLIFPHHENEIAQSEGVGFKFARFWMHNGLLTINGEKMAKSLGNFISIKDFITKHKDADYLKLLFLGTHYRHPVDYSEEKIEETRKQKKMFDDFFDKVNDWQKSQKTVSFNNKDKSKIDSICKKFEQGMDDDFNTPEAMASMFELIDIAAPFISQDNKDAFTYAKNRLVTFFNIFGLTEKKSKALPPEVLQLNEERKQAKDNKDYKTADQKREEIKKLGFIITDTGTSITFTEV